MNRGLTCEQLDAISETLVRGEDKTFKLMYPPLTSASRNAWTDFKNEYAVRILNSFLFNCAIKAKPRIFSVIQRWKDGLGRNAKTKILRKRI